MKNITTEDIIIGITFGMALMAGMIFGALIWPGAPKFIGTSDIKYHIAWPKGSPLQNCSVGQASSKSEAQKVADETGCPAYY